MSKTIQLKTWPQQFQAVFDRTKKFEWRREDGQTFEVGDMLDLAEFEPCLYCDAKGTRLEPHPHPDGGRTIVMVAVPCPHCQGTKGRITGRWIMVSVSYILRGRFGVPEGYAVMSIDYVTQGRRDVGVVRFEENRDGDATLVS